MVARQGNSHLLSLTDRGHRTTWHYPLSLFIRPSISYTLFIDLAPVVTPVRNGDGCGKEAQRC